MDHAPTTLTSPLTPHSSNYSCIDTLRRCQHRGGGFGGGPGQLPHLAPSYAAVNALVILGGPDALAWIDR